MKMARILAALLVLAMMFSVVGCGNTNKNSENSNDVDNNYVGNVNDGDGTNNGDANNGTSIQEFKDVDYTPVTEGLIGIAMWTMTDEPYPYLENQAIVIDNSIYSTMWEFYYVEHYSYGYGTTKWGQYEVTHIENNDYIVNYSSEATLVLGYIYIIDNKATIIATHDVVDYDETNTANFEFTIFAEGCEPYNYKFVIKHEHADAE